MRTPCAHAYSDRIRLESRLLGAARGVFFLVATTRSFFGFLVSAAFGFTTLAIFGLRAFLVGTAFGFAAFAVFGFGVGLGHLVSRVQCFGGKRVACSVRWQQRDGRKCRAQSDAEKLLFVHGKSPKRLKLDANNFRGCLEALFDRCHGVIRRKLIKSYKQALRFVSFCICNFSISSYELTA